MTSSLPEAVVIMGSLGAQVLTVVSLLFPIAYFEPQLLTFIISIKGNPFSSEIVSIWLIVLTMWGMIETTRIVGKKSTLYLAQIVGRWTKSSPENS